MLEESILAKEGSTYQEMAASAASAPARMPLTQPHFCCFVLATDFHQPKAVKFTSILASTGTSCFQKNFPHCLSLEIPGRDGSPILHAQLTEWAQRNGRKLRKWKKKTKKITQLSLNLGKSTRVCISLKTIHRHFWSK